MTTSTSNARNVGGQDNQRFELFKFFEKAATKAKSDAWTQTTWVLTLVGAVLAFSMNLYVEHRDVPGFLVISWACTAAALLLIGYITFVLQQLAGHIRNYWTNSNRFAAEDPMLKGCIPEKDAKLALDEDYKADYPAYIAYLHVPTILFAIGHVAWAVYVTNKVCA